MNGRVIGALLLAAPTFAGHCLGESPAPSTETDTTPFGYEAVELERSVGPCEGDSSPCGSVRLRSLRVLAAATKEAQERISRTIEQLILQPFISNALPPTSPESLAEQFLAQYQAAREAFPDAASTVSWVLNRQLATIYQSSRMLSLRLDEYQHAGEAHPTSRSRLLTLELATGQQIALEALVSAEFSAALNQVAEQEFRRVRQIPSGSTLSEAGFTFPGDRFSVNDNFALTAEGMLFFFNPSEVAPYRMGPTEILVPRAALAAIGRADLPLYSED